MKKNKKNKGEVMLEILQKKNRTKKEWIKKCTNQGINIKTFYYHFKKYKEQGVIKYIPEENEWMIVFPKDRADPKEIKLYIDQIKSDNKEIRDLGAKELINLCKLKVVEHDSFLMRFFKLAFKNESFKTVHGELLKAFRCILLRNVTEDNVEMVKNLSYEYKDVLMGFARSGPLKLQSAAINTLCYCPRRDVLEVLYEKIGTGEKQEYDFLKEAIQVCLKEHLQDFKVEMKRKLFEIAISTEFDREVNERAVDLLKELSGLRKKVYS
jgi:hypothetical protein